MLSRFRSCSLKKDSVVHSARQRGGHPRLHASVEAQTEDGSPRSKLRDDQMNEEAEGCTIISLCLCWPDATPLCSLGLAGRGALQCTRPSRYGRQRRPRPRHRQARAHPMLVKPTHESMWCSVAMCLSA